jgi:hypothetical protein
MEAAEDAHHTIYWVWTRHSWSTRGKVHKGVRVHEFDSAEKRDKFMENTTQHVIKYGSR